ncbi:hypothetical protein LCGC14_2691200 [marine sediment metagenome]|uniref:Uncharacterized protein n=1 Tax=marine sediment metagenome TaxID=412755 RepID=A0A0F9BT68_9ZZZZ
MNLHTITVPQDQCPICHHPFLPGDCVALKVVETFPYAFDAEYVHERCDPPSEREEIS